VRNELDEIRGGSARTWQNFYDLFWTIATVRYVTYKQLKDAFRDRVWCRKCVTRGIIEALVEKGYLNRSPEDVLMITKKTVDFLKTNAGGINTEIIKLPQGKGEQERLDNTQVLLKLIQWPDFYALFYPEFYRRPGGEQPFLIPDGALILRSEDKAKLMFLEIERPKGNWEEYLINKRGKYNTIATDFDTYDKWARFQFQKLKVSLPRIEDFCFSILCIGGVNYEWSGWEFKEFRY
jgi:hypothetical protein